MLQIEAITLVVRKIRLVQGDLRERKKLCLNNNQIILSQNMNRLMKTMRIIKIVQTEKEKLKLMITLLKLAQRVWIKLIIGLENRVLFLNILKNG